MTDKNKITSIAPLHYQYSLVSKESVPENSKFFQIDYKSKEIKEYEVLFFHRLLKKNYGTPSEIEYIKGSIKELDDGSVAALGEEWKYYIRTNSGIIQIGTENLHSRLKICYVLPNNQTEPSSTLRKEGEKFLDDLLREAQRLKGQIFNVQKEIENNDDIKLFLLDNVYLINYRSAELMLDDAEDNEQEIAEEAFRYGTELRSDSMTPEQEAHQDKFWPALGMYYASSISYFFMALEGFLNILYYAFLKDEIKSEFFNQQKLEERLDISTKILLMPSLCNGFKGKQKVGFLKDLARLTKYRNFFFHSKITDSLKNVVFVESGFLYTCDVGKSFNALLPLQKRHLKRNNVLEFKEIVDSIIKDIFDMMQDDSKDLVKKFVLNHLAIPFWRDKNGTVKFGTMDK